MLFILYVCLLLYVCLFVCLFVFGCCRGVFVCLFGFCLVLFSSVLGLNVSRSSNMYYKEGRKCLFYLHLFCVGHTVKDHSDSEREETRCRHFVANSFRLAAYSPSYSLLLHQLWSTGWNEK